MSSGNVPYHLRPNKHIERELFAELLIKICGNEPPTSFAYISMGGPQLEDHRLIHKALCFDKLYSFEKDQNVYNRQIFNQRPSCLKCKDKPISDFIDSFDRYLAEFEIVDRKLIVWLDYALTDRRQQLIEYQKLIGKLKEQDIVKMTLNANIGTFGERQRGEKHEDVQERRFQKIQTDIGDYLDPDLASEQMNAKGLIPILCHAIEVATEKGLATQPRIRPVLLSLFTYNDGYHQMLTATIRLVCPADENQFKRNLQWEFLPNNWTDIKYINVPSLTAKERLEIDGRLPVPATDLDALHDSLPFRLDTDNLEKSKELLREYALHYRRYPSYFQVIL